MLNFSIFSINLESVAFGRVIPSFSSMNFLTSLHELEPEAIALKTSFSLTLSF